MWRTSKFEGFSRCSEIPKTRKSCGTCHSSNSRPADKRRGAKSGLPAALLFNHHAFGPVQKISTGILQTHPGNGSALNMLCRNHLPILQRSFPSPRSEARGEDVAQRPERGFLHHLSPALSPNCVGGEGVQIGRPPSFDVSIEHVECSLFDSSPLKLFPLKTNGCLGQRLSHPISHDQSSGAMRNCLET